MNQQTRRATDSQFHRLEDERPDSLDTDKYGLGEETFRRFQEERKRAAREADAEAIERELAAERAIGR
jgi:hypothetical protein